MLEGLNACLDHRAEVSILLSSLLQVFALNHRSLENSAVLLKPAVHARNELSKMPREAVMISSVLSSCLWANLVRNSPREVARKISNVFNIVLTASRGESLTEVCLHIPREALWSAISSRLQQALRNRDLKQG